MHTACFFIEFVRTNTATARIVTFLLMGVFICLSDFIRYIRWLYPLEAISLSVLDRFAIIPAFEFQHIQHSVHSLNFHFHGCFLL